MTLLLAMFLSMSYRSPLNPCFLIHLLTGSLLLAN